MLCHPPKQAQPFTLQMQPPTPRVRWVLGRLRRRRLEGLRQGGGAAVAAAASTAAQLPSATEEVVLDTASIAAEAERFAPRVRRRGGALGVDAAGGWGGEGEGGGEESEEEDEDLMLDWRAKRV